MFGAKRRETRSQISSVADYWEYVDRYGTNGSGNGAGVAEIKFADVFMGVWRAVTPVWGKGGLAGKGRWLLGGKLRHCWRKPLSPATSGGPRLQAADTEGAWAQGRHAISMSRMVSCADDEDASHPHATITISCDDASIQRPQRRDLQARRGAAVNVDGDSHVQQLLPVLLLQLQQHLFASTSHGATRRTIAT